MLRFVKNIKNIVLTRAKKHNALISNTAVTVVLMTGADLLQQKIEHNDDDNKKKSKVTEYDLVRSRNITIVGLLTGPLMHGWYTILDTKYASKAINVVTKKVAIDQIFGSPLFLIVYFIGLSLLEGQTIRGSLDECKEKLPFAYLVIYKLTIIMTLLLLCALTLDYLFLGRLLRLDTFSIY